MTHDAPQRQRSDAASGLACDATARRAIAAGIAVHPGLSMFEDVPPPIRLQMELVARASSTSAAALPKVIELLVAGDVDKQTAIVTAIQTNAPLREQWEHAWSALRN